MFSFMKIATVAALAFGTFTSAMPVVEAHAVEARQSTTLTSILTQLPNDLASPVGGLNALTADTATPDQVTSMVSGITSVIDTATKACKGLPAGSIGVGDILTLLSVVIKLVITSCGKVYGLPGVDQGVIIGCFGPIGVSLVGLITVVLDLVVGLLGGVLSVVIGLLVGLLGGDCTSIIKLLNLNILISLLGL